MLAFPSSMAAARAGVAALLSGSIAMTMALAPAARAATGIEPLVQATGPAETPADAEAAIRRTLARYASAWYEGNAPRMADVLHPEFIHRAVIHQADAPDAIESMSGLAWLDATDRGHGRNAKASERRMDVLRLETNGGVADATLQMSDRIEHLHLVRWNASWRIVDAVTEGTR